MTAKFKNWRKKREEKEHELELITRRETILYNLFKDLTTEESISMYKDISDTFKSKIDKRFNAIVEEKSLIEIFLNK